MASMKGRYLKTISIILKWAQIKDGFISKLLPFTKENNWITNNESKRLVHQWRAQEQAILIGTNTALVDDPQLTVRLTKGNNPLRILIDKDLKVSKSSNIFSADAETSVFTSSKSVTSSNADSYRDEKHISHFRIDFSRDIVQQILDILYQKKILSIIIEGGAQTLQSFIGQGFWDEARVFTGNTFFEKGIKAPVINGKLISSEKIVDDELKIYKNETTNSRFVS
ncbi:unnamed protein product [Didymodactylos carnosus]|uniref:Bacterial bifunctional deaminase-reductase C-terminal domain-containing protein n=1 Tax=Didymodactylos carnosus TaxID=1234261 RepID=A0A814QEP1_9BILA|nr:unnamed protein product [Didymodactylos carnosus]CAF3881843.1 unnamed protein product [Didymodactylos carnosus]